MNDVDLPERISTASGYWSRLTISRNAWDIRFSASRSSRERHIETDVESEGTPSSDVVRGSHNVN